MKPEMYTVNNDAAMLQYLILLSHVQYVQYIFAEVVTCVMTGIYMSSCR